MTGWTILELRRHSNQLQLHPGRPRPRRLAVTPPRAPPPLCLHGGRCLSPRVENLPGLPVRRPGDSANDEERPGPAVSQGVEENAVRAGGFGDEGNEAT